MKTKKMRMIGLTAALMGVTICPALVFGDITTFQGLGDLPGGNFSSVGQGVSADHSVIVGGSFSGPENEAFRWTSSGGMIGLGDLPGGEFYSHARDVSGDGSVVVGRSESTSGMEAFRWQDLNGNGQVDPNEKLDNHPEFGLGDLPGGDSWSRATVVSMDGLVVAGYSGSASGTEAFRWALSGGMVGLGDLPGGTSYSHGTGVSGNGSVVVGDSHSASGYEAFRWQDLNGNGQVDPNEKLDNHPEFGLGDLPGGIYASEARDVSEDGTIVVGWSKSASGEEAFRWTSGGGMVGLGDLPGGSFLSAAEAVSADGSIVVGRSVTASGMEAFIWDEANGMQNLRDVLVNDYSLDLTGWTLNWAYGISDDGLTIVGGGVNPSGNIEAWAATIPEPATLCLLGVGLPFLRRRSE